MALDGSTVDVVIPTFNSIAYLPDAVESVLAQTHRNVRIYVVDDGSTDATPEYVRGLSDERVKYIRKENGGPSSARNAGISASESPYIALLDSDDRWYSGKLEHQLRLIKEHDDVALVHGYQHTIDVQGRIIGTLGHDLRGRVFARLLAGNFVTGSDSMVLLRREALDRVGLFREDLVIGEDWELWLRLARDYAFDYVPEFLAAIRVRPGLQSDRLLVAANLVRAYSIVTESVPLRRDQRAQLARTCLGTAAYDYALVDQVWLSLRTLGSLLRVSPLAVVRMRSVKFYVWVMIRFLRYGGRPNSP
jgi:glycosyltransferase involved in cell wall biosynthesis